MAKKANLYSATQIDILKRELNGVVEYLENLNLQTITDIIDWKPTKTGGMMPTVISSIEKIISTAVGVIKQSAGIIIAVHESEGLSDLLDGQITITTDKLNELQDYFFSQNLNSITDRKLEVPVGKGKVMKIIVASKEDQIIARGRITENVLKIVPMIDTIKSYKALTARGGIEVTESMVRFNERREKNEKIGAEY